MTTTKQRTTFIIDQIPGKSIDEFTSLMQQFRSRTGCRFRMKADGRSSTPIEDFPQAGDRYEINLYFEMFYPDFPEWSNRREEGLPDYNLVFLADLVDPEETLTDDLILNLRNRFFSVDDFFKQKEEFISIIHVEYVLPNGEGFHSLDWDDCIFFENTCGQEDA